MTAKEYDKLFAAGMALVCLIMLALMLATLDGCTVEHKQSITIKKAEPCAVKK